MTIRMVAVVLCWLVMPAARAEAVRFEEERAMFAKAAQAFAADDFKSLEEQDLLYRTTDRRTVDGRFKIELFDSAISATMDYLGGGQVSGYQLVMAKTKAWTEQFPQAPMAHVLHARALLAYAFHFRGTGLAKTVPPAAWASYRQYAAEAGEVILKSREVASKNTSWHVALIVLARIVGWPRDVLLKTTWEATNLDRDDFRIYRQTLTYFLPKWRGSDQEVDWYIARARNATIDRHGMEIYARLYDIASQEQYSHALYKDSGVSWVDMKQGLEAWTTRFPTTWNINVYAYHACLAEDKVAARDLLSKIGDKPMLDAWEPNASIMYSSCKEMFSPP